jgi:preprotein translocase subunit SecB
MDQDPSAQPPSPAPKSGQPNLQIISQYIRDLSFENPNAPESIVSGWPAPDVMVRVFLGYRAVREDMYESVVQFRVESKRKDDGRVLFIADLHYAAVAILENIPKENHDSVIMIDVPRLLFPFAREIIANLTANGGYPPLYLAPVSFETIYDEEMSRRAREGDAAPQS